MQSVKHDVILLYIKTLLEAAMQAGTKTPATALILAAAYIPYMLLTPLCQAAAWHEPNADTRVTIGKNGDTPDSDTGFFLLWPDTRKASETRIRITTESGQAVRHKILWASDGDPIKAVFDCASKQPSYHVYFLERESPAAAPFEPASGIVLETRGLVPGPVDSWEQILALWTNSLSVLGRSVVPNIFGGIHLHGETRNFQAYYKGYLNIEKGGDYSFATCSDDASCLLLDGRMVAQWPGAHGVHDGMRGKYSGNVNLAAGRHRIEYYNVQIDYGFSVAAAWKPPGKEHHEVIPSDAFAPVSQFTTDNFETRPGKAGQFYMTWNMDNHCMVGEHALVSVTFSAFGGDTNAHYEWTFDDGAKAAGPRASHVFFRLGAHTVRLDVRAPGAKNAAMSREINVRPNWAQQHQWPDAVFAKQKESVLAMDMSKTPIADLVCLLRLADIIQDREILDKAGILLLDRRKEILPGDLELLFRLGVHFQHYEVRNYHLARQCFTAVLGAKSADPALVNKTRLHLAGFLIRCRGDSRGGKELLEKMDRELLSDTEKRLAKICEADALLGEGHANSARRLYFEAGTTINRNDPAYSVKRRMRLETAKANIGNGDYDDAERIVREIEWETPLEKLDTETGLIMVKVHIGREEHPFALSLCNRLLNAAPLDSNIPEILYHLVGIALATGDKAYAAETLKRLKDENPYSEATALANDRWKADYSTWTSQ